MKPVKSEYASRNIQRLDMAGGHYTRHMLAMATESLHEKSDIAAELAWRDAEIEAWRERAIEHQEELRALKDSCDGQRVHENVQAELRLWLAEQVQALGGGWNEWITRKQFESIVLMFREKAQDRERMIRVEQRRARKAERELERLSEELERKTL